MEIIMTAIIQLNTEFLKIYSGEKFDFSQEFI